MEATMATDSPAANDAALLGDQAQLVDLSKSWRAGLWRRRRGHVQIPDHEGTFDGKPMGELHGYLMDVWRRTNDNWQVVSRTSVDLPGRESAPEATTRKNP
jgi:hypothetical protein